MTTKEKLLETNLIQDNVFLDQYCQLITSNLFTLKQKGKTQQHHVFPRCLSKILRQDTNPFVVNLMYKDHLIAHCLLVLAAKENQFKYLNMCAVYHILGSVENKEECMNLDLLQQAYEQSRKQALAYNPMNIEEHRQRHDEIMRNKDVRDKISQSMKLYRSINSFSDEHKNRIRQKAQGQIFIHKDNQLKHVSRDRLSSFLNEGWELGALSVPREIVDKRSRKKFKPVQCIDVDGNIVKIFCSVKDAALWWSTNGYTRKVPKNPYDLSNAIKDSYTHDKFICGLKWIYLSKEIFNKGDDLNESSSS